MTDILALKKQYRETLLRLPNVVGVGVGPKVVNGTPTAIMAIKVYVRSKVPKDRLGENECVPEEIDGIPTDVEVQAPLQAR